MNEAQQTAISRHCRLAIETMNPRFNHRHRDLTVVLTVNSGYE